MRKFLPILLATSLAASTPLFGQAISQNGGSIQGTIMDNTGAAIPGASVTVSSPDTGYSRSLKSDGAGSYSVGPLQPGSYLITVVQPGFTKLTQKVVVQVGTVTTGNEKLTIGAESQTVEVSAQSLQVNTDQIGVAGVISQEQIDTLPVNGRNILDIAQLEPGVILQQGQSFDPTKAGYSAISVDGVSGRTTRILLDGQDITDETVGTTIFNVPSGAVQEFQLNRSTQDISGEVTSTGQVLVSTRSGTNTIHGNLFYNFQDKRAGFASVLGATPPFQRNQFGGYIGGPIIKDKLFIFGGSERILQHELDPAQGNPTFSGILKQYPFIPAPFRDTYSTLRLDYAAPKGIRMFVRGTYSVNADDATFGLTPYSVYANRDNVPAIVGGADFSHGRFTHSFRVGYEKFHNILGDGTAALGSTIYNPSTGPANQISLVGSFDAGPNYLAPQGTFQSDKQFRYDGTYTRGRHNIKFGYSQNRLQNGGFAEFYGASLYTSFAAVPGLQVGTATDNPTADYIAAAYVLGNGNSLFSERPGFGLAGGDNPSWRFAAYVGDTYKVSSAVTLTAGLRWSVDTDRANQDLPTPPCGGSLMVYTIPNCTGSQPLFNFYGSTTGAGTIGYKTHQPYGNFGPQAGFVVSPGNHKTSIRGGMGIYYESDIFNNTGNSRGEVIPSQGAYFNYGVLQAGGTSVALPGLGVVTAFNNTTGAPCTTVGVGNCVSVGTVSVESIAQAAPQLNALKAYYQSQVQGKSTANPSYIGNGDGLFANNIYAGPYVSPYSIQINGGVQQQLAPGLIISVDYLHNATLKVPLSIDYNHDGAARTLNTTAAKNAVAATTASFGCAGGSNAAAINCAIAAGASITDFAGNGLDSGTTLLGGYAAQAYGLPVNNGAAFPGDNPNVGEGLFIVPQGRSGYDALQLVLQQQKHNPLPGIVQSNLQISYSLSRITSSASSSDQYFAGARPYDNDNPNQYMGPNALDRRNELSFGGDIGVKYGIEVGAIAHFYSAPPTTLALDATSGGTAQIFTTDVDGDGTYGDLVPGTNPGSYMRKYGPHNLNQLITNYNTTKAGQLTPAGTALVTNGIFTAQQLAALGAVQQPIAQAPSTAIGNSMFENVDLSVRYPITLSRVREGLKLTPGVAMYNVFNMGNFGSPSGTLLNTIDAGAPGYVNGPTVYQGTPVLNSLRVTRGSGTFDQGGPRSTEFQLKLEF